MLKLYKRIDKGGYIWKSGACPEVVFTQLNKDYPNACTRRKETSIVAEKN